ncbi:sulfotransferase family 2 domain-containing protein [Marinobacter sp. DUT-3]|uniref:sulfotransferase family 2 domain-containing protein n=1 Tax=Marinobacter sp. DUT-3 TaxID=3412036 RepID=UPI003D1872B0
MPVFSKGEMNILFVHIPKSAGSSIERIGSDLGWEESFSVRGKALKNLEYYKATLQHLHVEPLELLLNFDNFDAIFTVVRNPFYRFKSEYYWQRAQGITDLGVGEWICDTFEKYSRNQYVYDNHIRPQVDFLSDHEKFQVFKLEEGGVDKAREVFLYLSSAQAPKNFWEKYVRPKLMLERQEKRSVKDPEVEAMFAEHYDKIVEFYKEDFSAFSYKI